MTEAVSGLLVLDKPAGITSYDCIRRIKRILPGQKIGHCGTLDPLAQGVLLVVIGRETRRQSHFQAMEKQYWFRAAFGVETSTGDREGEVMRTANFGHVTRESLEQAAQRFVGVHAQVPPRYAALKYKGRPYYEYARKGIDIPRAARDVQIASCEILSFDPPLWEGRVVCSRGTYIRTLVEDIARELNSAATLDALIRERIGAYERRNALVWDDLDRASREELIRHVQP